ncbi:hypothetical protein AALP_AA3G160900 [Arabis alpina]|uniref:Myb/SANT-like DNA-binding domain-containing protein n=1 Tax=Arabis alpina TaxID=50452 RepID=A0A087H9I8_ARAAL|nr:hypothetical protein AALP_AA3G160900 [Arabis alpina]
MDEDDETQSRPSPENSLSPDPPIGVTTTTAKSSASSPSPRDGLALMVSPPNRTRSGGRRRSGGGGGGGRDDCWSEEATEILIDAWGERFMELKRGNLKQQHWKQVAEIVNSERINKSVKSDIQCKNRIDTVKKKFKQEKAKIVSTGENSKWVFFNKLQHLIGEATTTTTLSKKGLMVTPSLQQKRQGGVKRSSGGASSARWHFRKRVASETESESEPDLSGDDDSLPPPLLLSPVVDKSGGGNEIGEVVMAILGFAESYEKAESLKIKQMVEIEKERMKFAKELELQRMEFFKNQLEMFRNVQDDEDEDGERRSKRSHHSVKDNGNVRD